MTKAKTKYYRKKAVLKAISKYHRRKLCYVTDINWDTQGNTFIDGQQTNSFIIGEALNGNTSEFQVLGKQYGFVKLRGILIEAVYNSSAGTIYTCGVCLGHTNDSIVFGNLRTQPNILLFNSMGKTKMYYKVSSEFTSTNDIQLFNNIALLPFRQGSGTARYSLKITLYLTFKTNL